MTVTATYDDDEDIPTPDEDLDPAARAVLVTIRAIPDAPTRRAVMAVFVVAVLKGRAGR